MRPEDELTMAQGTAHGLVPAWAVQLVSDVATIRARTDSIPDLRREVEALQGAAVLQRDHEQLRKRVDTLWDRYNAVRGVLWLLGIAEVVGGLYLAFHSAGVVR